MIVFSFSPPLASFRSNAHRGLSLSERDASVDFVGLTSFAIVEKSSNQEPSLFNITQPRFMTHRCFCPALIGVPSERDPTSRNNDEGTY